jgi:predicted negative regulator of RcsB-dependent stress response
MPGNYFARLWRGDYFYRQGKRKAAAEEWQKALRIKPGDPAATRRLRGTPTR